MVLLVERVAVVDATDGAIDLDAGGQIFQPAIVGAVAITELEALMVTLTIQDLFENGIEDERIVRSPSR